MTDDQELNELMDKVAEKVDSCSDKAVYASPDKHRLCDEVPSLQSDSNGLTNIEQWTTGDDRRFVAASKTVQKLPPGLYSIESSSMIGLYFSKVPLKTEGIINFPQTNSRRVVSEIQTFWEKEKTFKDFGLIHKRGIILWGPPGSGKSCTIQLIMRDVIERQGIVIQFDNPDLFLNGMRLFRSIQPETPVVVLMEDIDEILRNNVESKILNLLDGVELLDKTVFLASTNFPENLGPRIINRPSRFDKRFKIGHPNPESRRMYFEYLFEKHPEVAKDYDLDVWIEDTNGISLAHLKELFVAVVILGDPYDQAIETLQSMKERTTSEYDEGYIGFRGVETVEFSDR